MTEKEKLLSDLVLKSGKKKEELESLISKKVDDLSGLISEEGAMYIIANELGLRLDTDKVKKEVDYKKIEHIVNPKEPVSLICKVIRKYERVTFSSQNSFEGSVQSLLVGDETGVTRLVFWQENTNLLENIHEGDILKVINAYTRENNKNEGRIEVHYGQYSNLEVNPAGVDIKLADKNIVSDFVEKKISEVDENDKNIKISGIITDFEIPRFYFGCPECFKKVLQDDGVYKCVAHGEVEPYKVPIVNFIIDDSTSTITVVGFRDRAEKMTGLSVKEIIDLSDNVDKYKAFSKKIIGSSLEVLGNVSLNSMSGEVQLLVNQVFALLHEKDNKEPVVEKQTLKPKNKKEIEQELNEINIDDDLDDIEEINFDEDLL